MSLRGRAAEIPALAVRRSPEGAVKTFIASLPEEDQEYLDDLIQNRDVMHTAIFQLLDEEYCDLPFSTSTFRIYRKALWAKGDR